MNKFIFILAILTVARLAAAQEYASAVSTPLSVIQPHEAFVPSMNIAPAPVIELRDEAMVIGKDVKLKSICRWNTADAKFFAPVADLTIVTLPVGKAFKPITVEQVRTMIAGAGVNLGNVRFMGPLVCSVTRTDTEVEKAEAFDQWAQSHEARPTARGCAKSRRLLQSCRMVRCGR